MPAWYSFSAAAIVCSLPTRIRDIRFCNKQQEEEEKEEEEEEKEEEEEEEEDHTE